MEMFSLLKKYDVPTPRYTSYPTVPCWNTTDFRTTEYLFRLKETILDNQSPEKGVSLYIHLPYCEQLCTYCGCNKRITKNHAVEKPYIDAVLKEWKMYVELVRKPIYIAEIHLGGGTPTFFSEEHLDLLLSGIFAHAKKAYHADFSVEVHPNYLTEGQLDVFRKHGFHRLSIGVQDINLEVQQAIHRIQPPSITTQSIQWARKRGFNSINLDLVYGLPKQTLSSIQHTVNYVISQRPERVALYSYAHVPWKSKSQRGYAEDDLPSTHEKWEMFQTAESLFLAAGYHKVGMDHFALPSDSLAIAQENKTLHRNFMGYTPRFTAAMIGLGVSSISECGRAFAQNDKEIDSYIEKVNEGYFPIEKGHLHSELDLFIRKRILDVMCLGETHWNSEGNEAEIMNVAVEKLKSLEIDGLVHCTHHSIQVTPKGKPFIRNICHTMDQYQIGQTVDNKPMFSKSI